MIVVRKKINQKLVYTIVFISLIFWAVFAFLTMNELISSQQVYAKLINISGKQRMLSQKSTLLAKQVFENKSTFLVNHASDLINEMKDNHAFLLANITSKNLEEVYFSKNYLDKKVKEFFHYFDNYMNNNTKENLNIIEEYSFSLLPELNHAVSIYEKESNSKTEELKNREFFILVGTIFTLILEGLIIVIPALRINELREKELKELNESLENRVKEEVEKVKDRERLISEQSKTLTMREILNNIAHQWRQPLSVITTSASGIKLKSEFNQLNEQELNSTLDEILKNSNYLSSTIDKFRVFFESENDNYNYTSKDVFSKTMESLAFKIEENNINIISNIKKVHLKGNESRLFNVLVHLISNAIDALMKIEKDRYIFINMYEENDEIIIVIKDNGLGIEPELIEKVFEPYYTTKYKSLGKGLSLFSCKDIIENIFKGEVSVKNVVFKHKNKMEKGAQFTITLPL